MKESSKTVRGTRSNVSGSPWLQAGGLVLVAAVLGGCATTPGTRPDDMSAAEHREAAAEHDAEASAHEAEYDPESGELVDVVTREPWEFTHGPTTVYNPTAGHLADSAKHSTHAHRHSKAAAKLERFVAEECRLFAPETRVVCPLVGTIVETKDTDGGVRIRLEDRLPIEAAMDHMRCHFAFGRAHGYEGMEECPLYLKGIHLSASKDGKAVEITSEDPATALEIRSRTATHSETR